MSILVCVGYSCCLLFGLVGVRICCDEYSFISVWLSYAGSSSFEVAVGVDKFRWSFEISIFFRCFLVSVLHMIYVAVILCYGAFLNLLCEEYQ
jgi:hypothetical protein